MAKEPELGELRTFDEQLAKALTGMNALSAFIQALKDREIDALPETSRESAQRAIDGADRVTEFLLEVRGILKPEIERMEELLQ